MNKHTRAVLGILVKVMEAAEMDHDMLNDGLQSDPEVLPDKIDQVELREELVKRLIERAGRTADEMMGMVQQVYEL